MINGSTTGYFESGQKSYEGTMRAGKREGSWKSWREDGTPNEGQTGTYRNGKKVG